MNIQELKSFMPMLEGMLELQPGKFYLIVADKGGYSVEQFAQHARALHDVLLDNGITSVIIEQSIFNNTQIFELEK